MVQIDKKWGTTLWNYRKNLGVTRQRFAEQLGISVATLRSYETLQREPGYKNYKAIENIINKTNTNKQKDDTMSELLEMKDRLIKSLENEKRLMAELLESKSNDRLQKNAYGEGYADICLEFDINISWNGVLDVKYHRNDISINNMAKKLGYSNDAMSDFLMVDKMVAYKEHNIHKLRSPKQKKEMLNLIKTYMASFKSIRMTTNSMVAEIPVFYTHKNGTEIAALVEYRVNWVNGTGIAYMRWQSTAS